MIGAEEKQTYMQDGYCLDRKVIPQEAITAARARVHEMIEEPPEWAPQSWQVVDPARALNSKGQPLPAGIQRPARFEGVFAEIAHHPNLVAAMTTLLGGEVELRTDQIGVKHGFITEEQGGRTYHHQDAYYLRVEPEIGANCWIPLDEVGLDAIALAVKPGTQRGWKLHPHQDYDDTPAWGHMEKGVFRPFQRHRIPLNDVDVSDEIVFPMVPGDGVYFTNYTWHRSEPNRSGKTLLFYAMDYQLTKEAVAERRPGR